MQLTSDGAYDCMLKQHRVLEGVLRATEGAGRATEETMRATQLSEQLEGFQSEKGRTKQQKHFPT